MSTCKSCGAEIFWMKTVAGKSMPLDRKPVMGGNISLGFGTDHLAYVVESHPGIERYVSHFATCPSAKQHRKAKP